MSLFAQQAPSTREKPMSIPNPTEPGVMHQASVPGASDLILVDNLLTRLKNYTAAMKPGQPIDAAQGAIHQTYLWQTIKWVLSKERGEFAMLYSELLGYILQNRTGVFSERYVYRFFEQLRMSTPDRRNFERVLHLLLATCDPKSRQIALRQIDFKTALSGIADNQIHQRVVGYYQV